MTTWFEAEGATLDEALRRAIAELADCDADKVELRVQAPGLEIGELAGVRVTLEVLGEDEELEPMSADPEELEEEEEAEEEDEEEVAPAGLTIDDLDEEAEAAADFLEGLLDAMELPGDLQIRVHDDHAEVEVVNVGSGRLIGRRGQTLDAIQELVRSALQRRFERRSRVMLDIEGYRARRLDKYLEKAREAIQEVLDTGQPQRLEPMDVYERKAVHQLVAEHQGVTSSSWGREPTRRVVIERD